MRERIRNAVGEEFVVRTGPARAPKIPKTVSGITKVAKSLSINSHSVLRWNKI